MYKFDTSVSGCSKVHIYDRLTRWDRLEDCYFWVTEVWPPNLTTPRLNATRRWGSVLIGWFLLCGINRLSCELSTKLSMCGWNPVLLDNSPYLSYWSQVSPRATRCRTSEEFCMPENDKLFVSENFWIEASENFWLETPENGILEALLTADLRVLDRN